MIWPLLVARIVSTSSVLRAITCLLVLAGNSAGYYRLNRLLLPELASPWSQRAAEVRVGPLRASQRLAGRVA